jgi:transcriptional regulator with XRE-family HTH domain
MKATMQDVAAVLREEREKRNLTVRDVAHRAGVKPSWLRRKESGRVRIFVVEFVALAKAIGFDAAKAVRKLAGRA